MYKVTSQPLVAELWFYVGLLWVLYVKNVKESVAKIWNTLEAVSVLSMPLCFQHRKKFYIKHKNEKRSEKEWKGNCHIRNEMAEITEPQEI